MGRWVVILVKHRPKPAEEPKKKAKPKGWYSKAAREERKKQQDAKRKARAETEAARQDHLGAKKRMAAAAKRRGEAMNPSLVRAIDRLEQKGRVVQKQWDAEREMEAKAKKKAARKTPEKKKPGEEVTVFSHGRRMKIQTRLDPLAAMKSKNQIDDIQWSAAKRFSKDFEQANFSGLSSISLEPAVDGGGISPSNPAAIAAMTLRKLKDDIGDDPYMILVAICGYGFTISQLSDLGAGKKDVLGDRLRDALNKADGFYSGRKRYEPSRLMRTVMRIVEEMGKQIERKK